VTKRETKKAVQRRATRKKEMRANGQLKSKRERTTDELRGGILTGEGLLTEYGFGLLAGILLGFAMAGGFDKSKTSDVGNQRARTARANTTEKAN
jgi:hypothetical protein